MKKVFLFVTLASVMVACGGKEVQTEETVDSLVVPTEEVVEGGGVSTTEEVVEPVSEEAVK